MPVTASEYAALAYAAYGPAEGGDVDDKIYEFSDGKIEKGTFELLESTNEFIVVRKVSTGETVLSVKGTTVSNARDLVSDAVILFGAQGSDPRLYDLINTVRKYKKTGVDISVTGHSLGGSLAAHLAKNENVMGVVFNMGAGFGEILPTNIASDMASGSNTDNVINFYAKGDPLSWLALPFGRYTSFEIDMPENPALAHLMNSFKGLDDDKYQKSIDGRAKITRDYRGTHPDDKVDDYSMKEKVRRAVLDYATYRASKEAMVEMFRRVSSGGLKGWTVAQIAALKLKIYQLKDKLNAMRYALKARDLQGAIQAGVEIHTEFAHVLDDVQNIPSQFNDALKGMGEDFRSVDVDIDDPASQSLQDFFDDDENDIFYDIDEPPFDIGEYMPGDKLPDGSYAYDDDWADPYTEGDNGEGVGIDWENMGGGQGEGVGEGIGDDVGVDIGEGVVDMGDGVGDNGEGMGIDWENKKAVWEGIGDDVGVDIGEGVLEGVGVEVGGEVVSAISAEVVLGLVSACAEILNGLLLLVSVGFIIYDIWDWTRQNDEYTKLQVNVDARSREYDGRMNIAAKKANVTIPPLPKPYSLGRIYIYGQYQYPTIPWDFAELIGGIALPYLEMRGNNPGLSYKPSGVYSGGEYANELSAIMTLAWELHPSFPFIIGDMTVRDSYMQLFTNKDNVHVQRFITSHKRADMLSGMVTEDEFSGDMAVSQFVKLYKEYSEWSQETFKDKFIESYKAWLTNTHIEHGVNDNDALDWLNSRLKKLKDYIEDNPIHPQSYDDAVNGIEALDELVVYVEGYVRVSTYLKKPFSQKGLNAVLNAVSGLRSALISTVNTLNHTSIPIWVSAMNDFVGKYDHNLLQKGFDLVMSDPSVMLQYITSGVDLGHFQTYLSIGAHGIMNTNATTVADYNSKKGLIDRQLSVDKYDLTMYYQSGGKPVGDSESMDEFNTRFLEWRRKAASVDVVHEHVTHITQPPVDPSEPPASWGVDIPTGVCKDVSVKRKFDFMSATI